MQISNKNTHCRVGAEQAAEIAELATQYDIFRFMKNMTDSWGMKAFMVLDLTEEIPEELAKLTVITNWPIDLLQQYDQDGFIRRSNAIRQLKRSNSPFIVDAALMSLGLDDAWIKATVDLFSRHGMLDSIWCPVYDNSGVRGGVALAGARSDFTAMDLAEFQFLASHIYGRLSYVRSLDFRATETLNEREVDCLIWTSAGKTSAEIAEIMQLSEHTVNHYLNRATKKLGAVNRTQAVAKALRIGIIK